MLVHSVLVIEGKIAWQMKVVPKNMWKTKSLNAKYVGTL